MQANNTVTFNHGSDIVTIKEADELLKELFLFDSSLKTFFRGLFDLYEVVLNHDDEASQDAKYTLSFLRHFLTQLEENTTRSEAPQP